MAHIHELIDFTVAAYIVYEQKVLLVHHKTLQQWLPVGGHIELDEDPEEALLREIAEESGIMGEDIAFLHPKPSVPGTWDFRSSHSSATEQLFQSLHTPQFLNIHHIKGAHHHVSLDYVIIAKHDRVSLNPCEHNDIRWFSIEELQSPNYRIPHNVRFYGTEALSLIHERTRSETMHDENA
ncbi:MAG: NUDIX domain-containing protein [Patescibacteria group bacterium]